MSKSTKIIAGAGVAALAIAAIPAVASFADGETSKTGTATYKTTVTPSISITVNGLTDGALTTADIAAGAKAETVSHTITAKSNATYGYAVTAVVATDTNLSNGVADTFAYKTDAVSTSNAGWNLTTSGTTKTAGIIPLATTAATIEQKDNTSTAAAGDNFTIQFNAAAKDNQAAGTYSSKTVTYEINALDSDHKIVANS